MSNSNKTSLGERIQSYEFPSTSRKAFKGQPLVVRLKNEYFILFAKDAVYCNYGDSLSRLMVETSKALVDRFRAKIGYTQSGEITLVWNIGTDDSAEFPFFGRFQKIESQLAAYATAFFTKKLAEYLPEKTEQLAIFDARAFVVPNLMEAYHAILWRQQKAIKNAAMSAILLCAKDAASDKALQEKTQKKQVTPEMQETMTTMFGVNFNDYPTHFKRGTFLRRVKHKRLLSETEIADSTQAQRSTGPVVWWSIEELDIWLSRQAKPLDVLFFDAEPGAFTGAVNAKDVLRASGDGDL